MNNSAKITKNLVAPAVAAVVAAVMPCFLLQPLPARAAAQVFKPLYGFGVGNDGADPEAALVQGSDGSLYGTTEGGGASGYGTVFKITTNGVLTSLYSFSNGSDGASPDAGLVLGPDGSFYGTASAGGAGNHGTVFKITTNGVLTPLYSFTNGIDGSDPGAALVQASDGSLYGTALNGGNGGGYFLNKTNSGSIELAP